MKAKEMFEEMRFEYSEDEKNIYYQNYEYDDTYIIKFLKEDNMIVIEDDNGYACLTENEINAIHQQMKELGWL